MTKRRNHLKYLKRTTVMVLALALLAALVYRTPLRSLFDEEHIGYWIQRIKSSGHMAKVGFLLGFALLIGMGFPRTLLCFIMGGVFGFVRGALLAHAATMLGTMVCFWFLRSIGRKKASRIGGRFKHLGILMRERAFMIVLLVRFCPVGNNLLTSSIAAISSVRSWPFFWGSFLGMAPFTILPCLAASGITKARHHQTVTGLGLMIVTSIVFFFYYRHAKLGKTVAGELENEESEDGENELERKTPNSSMQDEDETDLSRTALTAVSKAAGTGLISKQDL